MTSWNEYQGRLNGCLPVCLMCSRRRIKEFIRTCKRKTLENFLKIAELPTGGLKNDLLQRLINYVEVGPSSEFLSAVSQEMQTTLSRLSSVSITAREAANDYTDARAPQHMQPPGEPRPSFGSGELPLAYSSASVCPSQHASASKSNSNRQAQKMTPERANSTNCLSFPTTRPNVDTITLATSGGIFRIPTCPPGLSFTSSPFFKVIEVIRPPTILSPSELNFIPGKRPYERALSLKISIDQAEAITYHSQRLDDKRLDFGVQVIMRFARLDPSDLVNLRIGETKHQQQPVLQPQPDNFPIHLMLHVNGRPAQLPPLLPTTRPGLDGRRNARPVNITPLLRVSPAVSNIVKLVWTHDYATYSYFYYAVYLARKRSTRELCEALRRHSFQSASVTKQKIIEKLASTAASTNTTEDADLVIENTLPVQLLCPLSKCRIDLPVRGQNCQHIQCYDANTYLLINERKPAWKCPVCDVPAPFHELLVDGLILEILADTMAENLEEIVFKEDSSWSPVGKFGSPSNAQHATGATTASWADTNPPFPKQQPKLLSCSTCPPELPTSSQRFFQPSEEAPVSMAVCGSGGGGTSGSSACGSASSASAVPSGLESRKRSLPASSVGATFSLPRSSPTSSVSSSQAPESEPGLTIDLTESDEESEVSGKRRPSEKFLPEAIRPRSVGKPPTETAGTGLRRPSSLNSGGFSQMAAFGGGAAGASYYCSSTASSVACLATTPTKSTSVQRGGHKLSNPMDAQPSYHQQHSYPPPSGHFKQQQQHPCESTGSRSVGGGSGSGSSPPNSRGISSAAAAAAGVAAPAVSGASYTAPFASTMLACATDQFYSAMLTNSVAAARSSSGGGAGALTAVSTATNGGSPPLHSVPSTAALRSCGQPPSVPQSPSSAAARFNSPVDYPSHLQRSLSLNEAHHHSPAHALPKQRTLLDPTFKWRVPSPPSSSAAQAQGGTLAFPLRPNTCSPQEHALLHEAFRRQHLSSPSFLPPHTVPHYSNQPPNSTFEPVAHTSGAEPSIMNVTAACGNRFRPTLRSQQQVHAASVAAAAAAAAAATLSSMQPAAAYQHHRQTTDHSSSNNPLSCLIDAQRNAALLAAASSPAVARAAEAWLARSMFGMAVAAAASPNNSNDGPYHQQHHPSSFGNHYPGSSASLLHSKPPNDQTDDGGGAAMDPRPGWPYAAAAAAPSSSASPPSHQPRPPHL